ncbi:hypothetical protein O3M35_004218 [Rhynocoris fuscipes]|uniref:peptidylamidoglycolate lyase n=1 Tax=Rhynocoris fuscipes TaxID=488301 RepID=A0AAW1CIQ4_9HEMI
MIFEIQLLSFFIWIIVFSEVFALYEIKKRSFTEFGKNNLEYPEKWIQKPWLDANLRIGQVSGVSISHDNQIYLFHRADRIWSMNSFTLDNVFNERNLGPIRTPTILVITSNGSLINQWGADMFYLPHGITVDSEMNVWVTDVALHQVMKFSSSSRTTPSLSLGVAFTPGSDSRHLCKPTSVAVSSNGDFFVADGYCNSRILKFNPSGVKILEWGRHTIGSGVRVASPGEFQIPHGLTLAEDLGLICVADRENGRVQCFNSLNASFVFQLRSETIGPRIFSVDYCKSKGLFFVVNGRSLQPNIPVQGFILNRKSEIIGKFGLNLQTPHDLALSLNCDTVYVGELYPYAALKYEINGNLSDIRVTSTLPSSSAITNDAVISHGEAEGLAGAIMVTGACLVFAASLLIAAFVYSRTRRAGTSDTVRLLSTTN